MANPDETTLTEITILPDGRIYVFGLSQPVLEVILELQPSNQRLQRLHAQLQLAPRAKMIDVADSGSAAQAASQQGE